MLKKQVMAKKVSKFVTSKILKDTKNGSKKSLEEAIANGIESAYIAGYDLAVQECKDDNSRSGFEMAEHLESIESSDE